MPESDFGDLSERRLVECAAHERRTPGVEKYFTLAQRQKHKGEIYVDWQN